MIDFCNYCKYDNDTRESWIHCDACLSREGEIPNEFELKDTIKELIERLERES